MSTITNRTLGQPDADSKVQIVAKIDFEIAQRLDAVSRKYGQARGRTVEAAIAYYCDTFEATEAETFLLMVDAAVERRLAAQRELAAVTA